jgi:hypothetical protein
MIKPRGIRWAWHGEDKNLRAWELFEDEGAIQTNIIN